MEEMTINRDPLQGSQQGDVVKLRERLKEKYTLLTEMINVSPLQEKFKLPIEKIFVSPITKEDFTYNSKKRGPAEDEPALTYEQVKSINDIITIDGKRTRRLYMRGDAARGKTTCCLWLLKRWCDAQQKTRDSHNELEKILSEFDFVFYLPMGKVDPARVTSIDIICKDFLLEEPDLHKTIEHVLLNDTHRCLVIIDGLDEWKQDQQIIKRLRCKALPNFDKMTNCLYLITMRPWKFDAVAESIQNNDRVIELEGIEDVAIETVIEKVLVNHYGLESSSDGYKKKYDEIIENSKNQTMKGIMQIPMVAVLCVLIWYKGRQVGKSMAGFYASLIDMLIERACQKHDFRTVSVKPVNYHLPKIFTENATFLKYYEIQLKLGKVAYECLLSKSSVFQKKSLENEIGERELQFALDVGLISLQESLSETTKNVRIAFFHISVQEFLAANYIVAEKDVGESFYKSLSNIQIIMELSNVIMFICGMSLQLGSLISQRVVYLPDNDLDICIYRLFPGIEIFRNITYGLYKQQIIWYNELNCIQAEKKVTFHVSDIILHWSTIDKETDMLKEILLRGSRKFLSDHKDDKRSLYLCNFPPKEEGGISNTELNSFLSDRENNMSLLTLYIHCDLTNFMSLHTIHVPTLKDLKLENVEIQRFDLQGNICPPLLTGLSELNSIRLSNVSIGDRGLGISTDMKYLSIVRLILLDMSATGWRQFIWTLKNMQQCLYITLDKTNIDDGSKAIIKLSSQFCVTFETDITIVAYVSGPTCC